MGEEITSINLTFLLVSGTVLMVFLVLSVISAFLVYQRRMMKEKMRVQAIDLANQRSITDAILRTQEAERSRIAQDLHDELGAMIFSLKMKMGDMLEENETLAAAMEDNEELIDKIGNRIRSISHDMMPPALKHHDFGMAVKMLANALSNSSGIEISIRDESIGKPIDHDVQMILYRVLSEWINNIIKHSDARHTEVRFYHDNSDYHMIVEDDGRSFDFEKALANSSGLGLKGIVGRLNQVSATYMHYVNEKGNNTFDISLKLNNAA